MLDPFSFLSNPFWHSNRILQLLLQAPVISRNFKGREGGTYDPSVCLFHQPHPNFESSESGRDDSPLILRCSFLSRWGL
jgi:hypothetical protein